MPFTVLARPMPVAALGRSYGRGLLDRVDGDLGGFSDAFFVQEEFID